MSRRIFLESMRQEARHRGGYDSEDRSNSVADAAEARRAADAWRQRESDPAGARESPVARPTGAPLALAGAHADPYLPSNVSPLGIPELQRHEHRNGSTSATAPSAPAAAHADSPWDASSPAHAPLPAAYSPPAHIAHLAHDSLGREAATSISSEASSARRPFSGPRLSPDAAFRALSTEEPPMSSDGASTTAAASASGRRTVSRDGPGRRSSRSTSALGDSGARCGSNGSSTRRLSQVWGGVSQPRKSISITSPSAARRPSASASRHDRSGSINRMEAAMVALQVELATEKRNNIEAEHHITTLNREVARLRQENAQLSRDMARVEVSRGASPPPEGGRATPEAAPLQNGADAAAAATRIELLEARLSELSRNMETKQRELDTKDERIRLLEHKLADQLLLYSGMSYMGMIPGGAPQQQQPWLPQQPPPQQRYAGQTVHTSTHNLSDARSFESPARLVRAGEAPTTTSPAGAPGRKISAVRSVSAQSVHVIHDNSPGSRPSSVARSRGAYSLLNRPDFADSGETAATAAVGPAPTGTTNTTTTAHAASSQLPSTSPPREPRAPSATRDLRRPTPRRPSVRRGTTPVRTGGLDASAYGVGAKGLTPWSRVAADPHGTRSAPGSHETSVVNPTLDVHDAGAHAPRKQQPKQQPPISARSGSTAGPRRPSVQRRPSATVEQRRPSTTALQRRPSTTSLQRRSCTTSQPGNGRAAAPPSSSRRSSAASPLRRQSSGASAGGHPMQLHDPRAASPTGPLNSGVPPSSSFLTRAPSGRRSSATRSIAQQSIRSGTSTRSRPQITYSADTDTTTMKGTTTTVVFRTGNSASLSHSSGTYARDGAPLVPTRAASNPAAPATSVSADAAVEDGSGAAADIAEA